MDASTHREERGYLQQVVNFLVWEVVFDQYGAVVPHELLIFLDLFLDLRQFVEFVELRRLERLGVEGSDMVNSCNFSPEELKFVENDLEDRVAVLLLLEDDQTRLLLHKFYYIIIEAYLIRIYTCNRIFSHEIQLLVLGW